LNDDFLAADTADPHHIFAHAIAWQTLDPDSKAQSIDAVSATLEKCNGMTHEDAVEGLELLQVFGAERGVVTAYVIKAGERWTDARVLFERARGFVEES